MADYKSREFDGGSDTAPSNGNAGRGDVPSNGSNGGGHGNGMGGPRSGGPYPGVPGGPPSGSAQAADSGVDGFVQILSRQWHVLVLTTIAAVMLAVLYVMVAPKVYTAKSLLQVSPMDPTSISSGNNNVIDDADFLETQCVVIQSNAVLALAMDKIRETKTFHGVARPMDAVKASLKAEPSKTGKAIEVSYESTSSDDACAITDAVVTAYEEYESNAWKLHADKILSVLKGGTEEEQRQRDETDKEIQDLIAKYKSVPTVDPEHSPQHEEVMSLREEKRKAEEERRVAQSAYAQASRATIGNAELLAIVDRAEAQGMYSTNPQEQLQKYQTELAIQQAKLVDDSRQFGANHPAIVADQSRVNDMIVATVVASHEWVDMAQSKLDSVDSALKEAEKKEADLLATQTKYRELQERAEANAEK